MRELNVTDESLDEKETMHLIEEILKEQLQERFPDIQSVQRITAPDNEALQALRESSGKSGIPTPQLFIVDSSEIQMTQPPLQHLNEALVKEGFSAMEERIYLTTALLHAVTPEQLVATFSHEIERHIKTRYNNLSIETNECLGDKGAARNTSKEAFSGMIAQMVKAEMHPIMNQVAYWPWDDFETLRRRCATIWPEELGVLRSEIEISSCEAINSGASAEELREETVKRIREKLINRDDGVHGSDLERIARVRHYLPCPGEEGHGPVPEEMLEEARQLLEAPAAPQSGLPRQSAPAEPEKQKR